MVFENSKNNNTYPNYIEKKGKLKTGFWCISIYSKNIEYFRLRNNYVKLRLDANYTDKNDYIKVKFDINWYNCIIAYLWFPDAQALNLSTNYTEKLPFYDSMTFSYDNGTVIFDGVSNYNTPKLYILLDNENDYKKLFLELFQSKYYVTDEKSITDISPNEYSKYIDDNGNVLYKNSDSFNADSALNWFVKNWKLLLIIFIGLVALSFIMPMLKR